MEPDEYVELLLVEVQKPFIYANDFRAMKHSPKLKTMMSGNWAQNGSTENLGMSGSLALRLKSPYPNEAQEEEHKY